MSKPAAENPHPSQVYLIVDPAPLRPFVTGSHLVLLPDSVPAAVSDLPALTPAVVRDLVAAGCLRPERVDSIRKEG